MFWPWRVLVVMGLLWFARSQTACFLIATPWISQGEVIPSWQGMTEQTSRLEYAVITVCLNLFKRIEKQRMNQNESCRVLSPSFFVFGGYSPGSPHRLGSVCRRSRGLPVFFLNWRPSRGAFRAPFFSPQDNRLFSRTSWDLLGLDVKTYSPKLVFCFFFRWTEGQD